MLEIAETGKLPVVLFIAGGVATPADAAMMMQLGADGVFVGSGIFKSGNPEQRAAAIVKATTFYDDPKVIADVSAASARPWSASTSATWPRRTASPSAAGDRDLRSESLGAGTGRGRPPSASSPCRATSASTRTCSAPRRAGVLVRRPEELDAVDGLVIPGGESSVMDKLSRAFGLRRAAEGRDRRRAARVRHVRGLIMLADTVLDAIAGQETPRRTRRGRAPQRRSARRTSRSRPTSTSPRSATRRCTRCSSAARGRVGGTRPRRLAALADGRVVAVEQGNLLGTSFHPEIRASHRFHEYFLGKVRPAPPPSAATSRSGGVRRASIVRGAGTDAADARV